MSGTMNTVTNSTQTDQDPLSPTTLILNYLRQSGVNPTPDNIRRAVMANARESNMPGADPVGGLRNARPSSEAEDQTAMRAAGQGGANQGSGGRPLPVPPIPPDGSVGSPNTSAPPDTGGGGSSGGLNLSGLILAAAPFLGLPGASRNLGPRPGSEVPTPGGNVPPPVDPGANMPGQRNEIDYTVLPPEGNRLLGDVDPMERAMRQATMERNPIDLSGAGIRPPSAEMLANAPRGPATSDPALLNETTIRSGVQPAPKVPLRPRAPRARL